MAILYHPPSLLPFFAPNLLSPSVQHRRISWRPQECPSGRKFLVCASSSVSKPRRSRKLKSEELCNEIREFVSRVGLPEGHVPTLKEFSNHGRNDLANLVRRRGYKLMEELLASSKQADLDDERCLVESHVVTANLEEKLAGVLSFENATAVKDISSDSHTFVKENAAYSSVEGNERAQTMVEDLFPTTNGSVRGKYLESSTSFPVHDSGEPSNRPPESLAISTLERKVSDFIQTGDLDNIEDSLFGISNGSHGEESKELSKMEDEVTTQSIKDDPNCSEHVYNAAPISNGSSVFLKQEKVNLSTEHPSRGADSSEAKQLKDDDLEDTNLESIRRGGNFEIDRLRLMLRQKELEMSRLKEQIEKDKIALSELQIKAETEINRAQELVIQKDAELLAAEESLSGLEEVQIDYSGEGDIVEVAGSFNGWHQRIKMDPQPYSGVTDPARLRKSKIWSTVLWLYPGTYEIKFIVDGQWIIDPQRETVNHGGICNNILRVDR